MGDGTGIAWCDATWNPIRGCSRVSAGCQNCYAEKVAVRFGGPGLPYDGLTTDGRWNGVVRMVPERLADPLRWKRPRRIFVNSTSDLFHESLSEDAIAAVFGVMASAPRHTFQVLTKRPERMRAWFSWLETATARCAVVFPHDGEAWRRAHVLRAAAYRTGYDGVQALLNVSEIEALGWPLPNVWLGVSVEDQASADKRIPVLLEAPAAVRFISAEPLLGPVELLPSYTVGYDYSGGRTVAASRLNWVIVGGESGPGARPCDVGWIRSIVRQCKEAGVQAFVKQLGARPTDESMQTASGGAAPWPSGTRTRAQYPVEVELRDRKGGDPAEWPSDLRVREFPPVVGAVR